MNGNEYRGCKDKPTKGLLREASLRHLSVFVSKLRFNATTNTLLIQTLLSFTLLFKWYLYNFINHHFSQTFLSLFFNLLLSSHLHKRNINKKVVEIMKNLFIKIANEFFCSCKKETFCEYKLACYVNKWKILVGNLCKNNAASVEHAPEFYLRGWGSWGSVWFLDCFWAKKTALAACAWQKLPSIPSTFDLNLNVQEANGLNLDNFTTCACNVRRLLVCLHANFSEHNKSLAVKWRAACLPSNPSLSHK